MAGLRPPPREDAPSRLVARLFILILLVLAAGVLIWAAVTRQRITLTEDVVLGELEIAPFVTSTGTSLNIVREGEGSIPLVLLHDVDVTGSPLWDEVAASLAPQFDVLRVDLPGFGLSQRFPEEGTPHTVASMAVEVAEAVEQTFDAPVVIAGVGLGGEVASEIAVVEPALVAGLVMVDVDFYRRDGWVEFVERLPFVGDAATFTFEAGGPMAFGRWAPNCETGGWCPSASQVSARELAVTIVDTTNSIRAFRRTPAASLVPSDLDEVTAPVSYVWSQQGEVPRESVDRVQEAIPGANIGVFADAWKAHLDNPADVAAVIGSMAP